MKVRIARDLPIVPLGKSNLQGKMLVPLEDNAGFTMYEFRIKAGDEVTFTAFHEGHNHIYYCVDGHCTIHSDKTEDLIFTADYVLALTPQNNVTVKVQEPMRIVAVSVPHNPDMTPRPLLLKSLDDVINSDRNVFWGRGYSRRFLASPDGYNISVHNTLANANCENHLHYVNQVEGVYVVKGQGEYVWSDGKERHEFDPEKHQGTLFLLQHDKHVFKTGANDVIAICVFFPPLKGTEKMKFDKDSGSSCY